MNYAEWLFYGAIGCGNLLITTAWAKYGLLELGIQKPINKTALKGALVVTITIIISSYIPKIIPSFDPKNYYAIATAVVGPIIWLLIFRHIIMPPGLIYFNKARARANFWMQSYYQPGKILKEGDSLNNSNQAHTAIRFFKKGIRLQSTGKMKTTVGQIISLDQAEKDGQGNFVVECPACMNKLLIADPSNQTRIVKCQHCNSITKAAILLKKLNLRTKLAKPTQIISDQNHYNEAAGYEELAILYRIMNMFTEARQALSDSQDIVTKLLENEPENHNYQALKSMIIYRLAEIDHVLGNHPSARRGYEQSLEIDQKLDDQEKIQIIKSLLKKLNTN